MGTIALSLAMEVTGDWVCPVLWNSDVGPETHRFGIVSHWKRREYGSQWDGMGGPQVVGWTLHPTDRQSSGTASSGDCSRFVCSLNLWFLQNVEWPKRWQQVSGSKVLPSILIWGQQKRLVGSTSGVHTYSGIPLTPAHPLFILCWQSHGLVQTYLQSRCSWPGAWHVRFLFGTWKSSVSGHSVCKRLIQAH